MNLLEPNKKIQGNVKEVLEKDLETHLMLSDPTISNELRGLTKNLLPQKRPQSANHQIST